MTASRRGGRRPLGQHFLRNPHTVGRILDALGAGPGETVVEIGPGTGALTRPLLSRGVRVVAVEVDAGLAARLKADLGERGLFLVDGDAREADVGAALSAAGVVPPVPLVGNLPYESATPMIRAFVRRPDLYARLVVMVQKEVAQRLVASPGAEAYGFLSVDVAAHAGARLLFDVARGDFSPPPRVVSAVVELVPRVPEPGTADALLLASAGFTSRRKTLLNALSAVRDREAVRLAIAAAGLKADVRAETLGLPELRSLAARLPRTGP